MASQRRWKVSLPSYLVYTSSNYACLHNLRDYNDICLPYTNHIFKLGLYCLKEPWMYPSTISSFLVVHHMLYPLVTITVFWSSRIQITYSVRIGNNLSFTQLRKFVRRDSGNIDRENMNPKVEMIILAQDYLLIFSTDYLIWLVCLYYLYILASSSSTPALTQLSSVYALVPSSYCLLQWEERSFFS